MYQCRLAKVPGESLAEKFDFFIQDGRINAWALSAHHD